jgi:hypothetical protein
MYEQVDTGPLYEQAVQLLSTYRSVAARMAKANPRTQGKLDRRLERLGEQIAERLGELTDLERMALTGWRDGIIAGTYEVDHEALMEQPYESIRRIDRWTEEYDPADYEADKTGSEPDKSISDQLAKFLRMGLD